MSDDLPFYEAIFLTPHATGVRIIFETMDTKVKVLVSHKYTFTIFEATLMLAGRSKRALSRGTFVRNTRQPYFIVETGRPKLQGG